MSPSWTKTRRNIYHVIETGKFVESEFGQLFLELTGCVLHEMGEIALLQFAVAGGQFVVAHHGPWGTLAAFGRRGARLSREAFHIWLPLSSTEDRAIQLVSMATLTDGTMVPGRLRLLIAEDGRILHYSNAVELLFDQAQVDDDSPLASTSSEGVSSGEPKLNR